MMQRPWQSAADDEWRPQQLRTCFGGPSGDGEGGPGGDSGGFQSSDDGGFLGGSNFGTDTSSSNFGENTGGSNFSSDGGGFQSTDGGGFQSTSSGFSDSGGYTGGDYSGSYQGGDTGGYYSGTDGAGNFFAGDTGGGGYQGGNSLGGNVAADAAGGAPYGGGGAFGGGGFGGFQTAGQGQSGFGPFSTSDPGNPLSGLDPLGQIYTNEYGPASMAGQLGYESIGRNADQVTTPTNLNPDLATQLGINEIGRTVAVDPTVQPGERGSFGPPQSAPAYTRGSGMDMEFNPFGMYQAPAQDPGRQGSLIDMLNPVSQARADMISTDLGRSDMPNISRSSDLGEVGTALPQTANELNTSTLDALATQFGRDPAVIADLLNNAPYEGALGGPDVVGSRGALTPGSQGHFSAAFSPFGGADPFSPDPGNVAPNQGGIFAPPNIAVTAPEVGRANPFADPTMFDPSTYAPTRGADVQTPAWLNTDQLTAGVRGGSEMFNAAPQNLQQALQAQAGQQYQTPFANMPWGPTFSQPGLPVFDPTNMTFQTQTMNQPASPWNDQAGKTLDQLRAEQLQQLNPDLVFAPPLGPPTTFQPPQARSPQANVPLPTANPVPFAQRGYDVLPTARPETREQRTPVVERETSRAPLHVTVPGRTAAPPAQTQSRSSNQAAQQAARGDMRGLNSLLAQARDPNQTLAGRIAALDQLNGIISAMRAAGLPNPYGRDPDPGINAALRMGR